jgi:hypothetical protein
MIRILLDTNVVLDALLSRPPWNAEAESIFQANRGGQVEAHFTVTATFLTTYPTSRVRKADRIPAAAGLETQRQLMGRSLSRAQLPNLS